MKLTNDTYLILIGTKNFTERYYRDKRGWLKISARGRKFRMTAEQVLNHLLPAVAGVKAGLRVAVKRRATKGRPETGISKSKSATTPNNKPTSNRETSNPRANNVDLPGGRRKKRVI